MNTIHRIISKERLKNQPKIFLSHGCAYHDGDEYKDRLRWLSYTLEEHLFSRLNCNGMIKVTKPSGYSEDIHKIFIEESYDK